MKIVQFLKPLLIISVIFTVFFAIFFISPWPQILYLKHLYSKFGYTLPENYQSYKENVNFNRNIDYGSRYSHGVLDIITPKDADGSEKVIFWMHGGAFIGGDKTDVEHFMVMLANEGYSIVNVNYGSAPKYRYPVPLKQLEEAYLFIKENAEEYNLDVYKAYFGGDSAGAQIAAQFLNFQTNPKYARAVNEALGGMYLENVIDAEDIGGALLFCGPYDLESLINPPANTMLLPFRKIGWAYFGSKDTKNPCIALSSISDKVSENFPPAFIIDGNSFSFEDQAKELEKNLIEKGVYVKSFFLPKEQGILKHQYQFYLDEKHAIETLGEVIDFLNDTSSFPKE